MLISKRVAKPVRKTWKNQPASSLGKAVIKDKSNTYFFKTICFFHIIMAEIVSTFKPIHCDLSDSSSLVSTSFSSSSSFSNWKIHYKPISQKSESKGIWDGYQTQEEFITMHLR